MRSRRTYACAACMLLCGVVRQLWWTCRRGCWSVSKKTESNESGRIGRQTSMMTLALRHGGLGLCMQSDEDSGTAVVATAGRAETSP